MQVVITVMILVLWLTERGALSSQWNNNSELELTVVPLLPKNCENNTGNGLSNSQRIHIVDFINRFRAIVHYGIVRPKRAVLTGSNYRKVRYSCDYEAEAKFECTKNLHPAAFKSDNYTWRRAAVSNAIFDESMSNATESADTLRLTLPPEVIEIGCFQKHCNGNYFIACKTGHKILTSGNEPFYTPSKLCKMDSECTLPGYTRCDTSFGLCDLDPEYKPNVSPFVCFTKYGAIHNLFKENCNGVYNTGSDHSQAERNEIVDMVNGFRAFINNNCTLGLGVLKPASNYRKVKYSCALEMASKFECSLNVTYETFKSDKFTWRGRGFQSEDDARTHILWVTTADIYHLLIDPETRTVMNTDSQAVFIKLFMSEDVTKIGCYVKECGDKEYIACRTNHDRNLPSNAPLYTPGRRCNSDADCTLPGYHVCDADLGLCDDKSHHELQMEKHASRCDDLSNILFKRMPEKCNPGGYDTGSDWSNKEREAVVYFVNQFRQRINNNCDFGNGIVAPISNYCKVRYSCALEKQAKFGCTNLDPKNFESDMYTLRMVGTVGNNEYGWLLFKTHYPVSNKVTQIDPDDQRSKAQGPVRHYLMLMLPPNVTEVGCFFKICDGYEYLACMTGQVVVIQEDKPLYMPGKRCQVDSDCTLPGYPRCDVDMGLCDILPNASSSAEHNCDPSCSMATNYSKTNLMVFMTLAVIIVLNY